MNDVLFHCSPTKQEWFLRGIRPPKAIAGGQLSNMTQNFPRFLFGAQFNKHGHLVSMLQSSTSKLETQRWAAAGER